MIIKKDGYILFVDCFGCGKMRKCQIPCEELKSWINEPETEMEVIEPE